jgi:hypothetical protein
VLCPELYVRLAQRYHGGVKVANQGMAMCGRLLRESDGQQYWSVTSWGETYRINCPFCNDTRHRLWLPHRFGQPDPANPQRLGMFYGICFNEDCLRDYDNRRRLYDSVFGVHNRNTLREPPRIAAGEIQDTRLSEVEWPGHVVPLWQLEDTHVAWQYLAGARHFDRNVAQTYQLHLCLQADERYRPAAQRIIAPVIQFGMRVGWQGRYIGDTPSKAVPKYYTRPGMPVRNILYNHDRSVDYPFVVVFEGITDVWRFGDPSVAIFGKTLNHGQRLLLQQSWAGKPIVLCLDPEAREESAGILWELARSDTNPIVDVSLEPGRDPAQYETDVLWNIIYTQARAIGVRLPEIR